MSNFAIMRHIKIKGASAFNGIYAEASREISGTNVDKKRTAKNIILQPSPYKNYDDFVTQKKEQIRVGNLGRKAGEKKARFPKKQKNKKTKLFEDASLSQQFVFSYSNGALSEKEGIEYLKYADKFIREWFPDNEIIGSHIHLDETTPHIHIDVSYFDLRENRFNQKTLSQSGKTDIDAIRNAFQIAVADEFELRKQDGSVVEKHDGTKADLEKGKLKKLVAEQEGTIDYFENDLENQHMEHLEELVKKDALIAAGTLEIEVLEELVKTQGEQIKRLEKVIREMELATLEVEKPKGISFGEERKSSFEGIEVPGLSNKLT